MMNDDEDPTVETTGFNSPNFQACYRFYNGSYTAAAATDRCAELRKQGYHSFATSEFQTCFTMYNGSYTAGAAADRCVELVH